MYVEVISEDNIRFAIFGMMKSYRTSHVRYENFSDEDYERGLRRAKKLASKDGGHNKFLESIMVRLDIQAAREWWSHMDTYRVGKSTQSASTMHTLVKRPLTKEDFEEGTPLESIAIVNTLIKQKDLKGAKKALPEGFLQDRTVICSYKTLRAIYHQRKSHRLPEWKYFCDQLLEQLDYPEFIR